MKIKINFKTAGVETEINNQQMVISYLHNLLGRNNKFHDEKSDYSISDLKGGRLINGKINFKEKAYVIFSSLNMKFTEKILSNINSIKLSEGFEYDNFELLQEENYSGFNVFKTISPIMIKLNSAGEKPSYLTLDSDNFKVEFEDYLKRKIAKVLPKENFNSIKLNIIEHKSNKNKCIYIKDVANRCFHLTFNLECSKKIADYLCYNGVGMSTGSGFGSIIRIENFNKFIG